MEAFEHWQRIIVHADMDAFYAAVEQLDDPSLRGRPVIVGARGKRSVVSTASYEARPFGVGSAMPMATALRRCPHAAVIPPRFARYEEISRVIMEVFDRYSPLVEPLSLDEAFLDMTGAMRLFGHPSKMAARIQADVREATGGLTVSVGVATCKFVAKVASDFRKPAGITVVPPEQTLDFLWPLPVSRFWGVGPGSQKKLEDAGLKTISHVARASQSFLEQRFGRLGRHIARLSRGDDPRPVTPNKERKSVGAEQTLETDIEDRGEIEKHLRRAATKAARRLRREGLLAAGVRIKLKTKDFALLTRQAPLPCPTDTTAALFDVARRLLAQVEIEAPVRLVGVAAFDLRVPAGCQRSLFDDAQEQRNKKLDHALDQLCERFGSDIVRRGED